MAVPERLFEALSDMAQTLVGEYDVDDVLDRLCDQVVELLPAVTGAGVMLFDERAGDRGGLLTVAASDARIHAIERLQLDLGEGPCLEAWQRGEEVVERDLVVAESRWRDFAPAAVQAGMKAVYSFPLRVDHRCIGALNLFGSEPDQFNEDDARTARLLGDMATAYIINARVHGAQVELSHQLQRALDGRVVIEQAKGKLAGLLGIEVDEAFHHLRAYARNNGLRLHQVARDVVDDTLEITASGRRRDGESAE